jgi:aryl-alcohol dehydrogenase-like predicted oxidoreductase
VYSAGESEVILGQALAGGRRDNVVLSTKCGGAMGKDVNERGNSRRWIVRAVENSLRRLDTDYIDLYQLHRPDPTSRMDEALAAMSDLIRAGKILYAGTSTLPAHEMVMAQWIAERYGYSRFVSEQPPYSILNRLIENDVLPVATQFGMGVLTWGPLCGGLLSGRHRKGADAEPSHRERQLARSGRSLRGGDLATEAVVALGEVADRHGLTMIELSLAFVMNHSAVSSAVIGPRTMEQLESYLSSPEVELSDEILDEIDAIAPPGSAVNPLHASPPGMFRQPARTSRRSQGRPARALP